MIKKIIIASFIAILELSVSAMAAESGWLKFNQGLTLAAKEKKTILVDFYTSWCRWCKVMDEKTFQNPEIARLLQKRFVTIRVDAENANETVQYKGQQYTNVQLTKAFEVTGYPSLAFLDSKGEPITIIPGYVPPEEFIHILNYIDKECYKQQMSFDEFKKKLDCRKGPSIQVIE
jgi:thioredoxin-related protein